MSDTQQRSWEALRRGAPDRSRWAAEHRLEAALREGGGHVVVTAAKRSDAKAMATAVLDRIEPFAILRLSGRTDDPAAEIDALLAQSGAPPASTFERHRILTELRDRARECGKSVLIVVDGADAAHAARLEALRMAIDFAPDAVETVRIVLVGNQSLHETLDESGARALSSRVVARIHVPASDGSDEDLDDDVPISRLTSRLRKSLIVGACAVGVFLALRVAPPVQGSAGGWLTSARESVSERMDSLRASIASMREDAPGAGVFAAVRAALERLTAGEDTDAEPAAPPTEVAAAKPAPKKPEPARTVATPKPKPQPAAPTSIDRLRSSLAKPVIVEEPRKAAPVVAVAVATPPPPPPKIQIVESPSNTIMQIGAFTDPADAFALKKALGTRFGSLHVARFDAAGGPVYRVRVFGFRTQDELSRAQRTVIATGYVPELVDAR